MRSLSIPFDKLTDVVILEPHSGQGRLNEQLLGPENQSIWRHAATENYADCYVGELITDSRLPFVSPGAGIVSLGTPASTA